MLSTIFKCKDVQHTISVYIISTSIFHCGAPEDRRQQQPASYPLGRLGGLGGGRMDQSADSPKVLGSNPNVQTLPEPNPYLLINGMHPKAVVFELSVG